MTARRAGRLSLPFLVQRAEQHTRITARQQKPRPNQRPGIYEKGTAMTETTVNIPLLRKAVEWAEAEAAKPDPQDCRWFQGQWLVKRDCGTSYCIAGYVGQSLDERYAKTDTVDGVRVDEFAANALGLDIVGCDGHCTCEVELFDAKNSIEDVRRIAESIAGERL